jgi:predicted Fe-Mo cluster-binding NifX family protein
MKIAISSAGKDIESSVSEVFGRCPYFIIVEIEKKKIINVEAIANTSSGKMGGAGISSAQAIAEKNVKAVITGNMGPRASDVLKQFSIEVYNGSGSVKEALQRFIGGKLKKIQ